jgi:hypothetical protein
MHTTQSEQFREILFGDWIGKSLFIFGFFDVQHLAKTSIEASIKTEKRQSPVPERQRITNLARLIEKTAMSETVVLNIPLYTPLENGLALRLLEHPKTKDHPELREKIGVYFSQLIHGGWTEAAPAFWSDMAEVFPRARPHAEKFAAARASEATPLTHQIERAAQEILALQAAKAAEEAAWAEAAKVALTQQSLLQTVFHWTKPGPDLSLNVPKKGLKKVGVPKEKRTKIARPITPLAKFLFETPLPDEQKLFKTPADVARVIVSRAHPNLKDEAAIKKLVHTEAAYVGYVVNSGRRLFPGQPMHAKILGAIEQRLSADEPLMEKYPNLLKDTTDAFMALTPRPGHRILAAPAAAVMQVAELPPPETPADVLFKPRYPQLNGKPLFNTPWALARHMAKLSPALPADKAKRRKFTISRDSEIRDCMKHKHIFPYLFDAAMGAIRDLLPDANLCKTIEADLAPFTQPRGQSKPAPGAPKPP